MGWISGEAIIGRNGGNRKVTQKQSNQFLFACCTVVHNTTSFNIVALYYTTCPLHSDEAHKGRVCAHSSYICLRYIQQCAQERMRHCDTLVNCSVPVTGDIRMILLVAFDTGLPNVNFFTQVKSFNPKFYPKISP